MNLLGLSHLVCLRPVMEQERLVLRFLTSVSQKRLSRPMFDLSLSGKNKLWKFVATRPKQSCHEVNFCHFAKLQRFKQQRSIAGHFTFA